MPGDISKNRTAGPPNAANGQGPETAHSGVRPEKEYRKYDFYSPRKFTKDHIKMINSVFDSYTRIINTRLNGLLHANCEISVESVTEERYYEFANALTDGDVLTLAHMKLKDRVEDTPVTLYLSTPIALSMIDRLLGGEGDPDPDLPADYSFTDLELQLYESIVKDLISVMGSSWENYLPLDFQFSRVEINPTLIQLMSVDETVVMVEMRIKFPNIEGRLGVCLPVLILTNILAEINMGVPHQRMSDEDRSEEIFDSLRDSELEINAKMGSTMLTLRDIYTLHVGDVINLQRPKASPIYLEIGGSIWFSGSVGTYKNQMAVKIGETLYRTEKRSENPDGT